MKPTHWVTLSSLTLAALLLVSPATLHAQSAREGALVLRVLSYDANLRRASTDRVTVLVVYRSGNSNSEAARSRMVTALNSLGRRTTVASMRARASDYAYRDRSGLVSAARSANAVAIYVMPGLESEVSDISRAARSAKVLTLTSDARLVRQGLSVGLVSSDSRTRLIIDLASVRAEGARLDAALLRLAEVIR